MYHILLRSLAIADKLPQHSVVIVLDHAVYAKACKIVRKRQDFFPRTALVMGGFYTIIVVLVQIGKRIADAGLRNLMAESGVV